MKGNMSDERQIEAVISGGYRGLKWPRENSESWEAVAMSTKRGRDL